ncbi:MAG TPA: spermine synthase, partial [Chromatiales bacterium]|nr:spermine synthase [Chromatiales bacterium]HEX22360.1 spermine synthase [Chromatiales bacterium]
LAGVQSVAVVGLLVAVLAWLASLRLPHAAPMAAQERPPWRWLLIYGGIGVAALMLQIGWTRLFGMVLLRTEYVLAVILAIFLIGIGLGSLLARHMWQAWWFSVLPVIACGFALLSLWLLAPLSAWAEQTRFDSLFSALLQQGSAIVSLTLPVTLVLGAWLPLLTRRLGGSHHYGAWLYGANSLGAALGALLAGFLFIPGIGTSATIVSGALLLLVLGLMWAPSRRWWLTVPLMVLLAWPVLQLPPVSALMPAAYARAHSIYTHEDAISITHVIEREDGQRQLLADLRRMDASSDPTSVAAQMNQARLPLLLHPAPRSVLFLGLGTGISAAGSLPFPDLQRSAVELSQGAIAAARDYFTPVNGAVNQQLTLVRDDARHFLLSNTAHFDVIIGDLFHPDLVGRSALLSRQQFQRAYARLSEGGIFVQWLALNQFDTRNLDVVLRTFQRVFPDAVIFVDGFRLALVGSKAGPKAGPSTAAINAAAMLANLARMTEDVAQRATGGEGAWTWLGRYWGAIPTSEGPVQDEWAPVIEYQLPGARYSGALDLSQLLADLLARRPPLVQAVQDLQVAEHDFPQFERAYAATSLAFRSWVALLRQQPTESQRLLPLAYQANPADRWIGFAMADGILGNMDAALARDMTERQVLEAVLRIRPDHTEALRELWQLARDDGELALADEYRARLEKLSPLGRRLRSPGKAADIAVSDLNSQ